MNGFGWPFIELSSVKYLWDVIRKTLYLSTLQTNGDNFKGFICNLITSIAFSDEKFGITFL